MSKVIAVRLLALSCLVLVRTGPTPGDADETACSGGGSGTFVVQELIDPLPDDCDRLVAPNSGVAAAVLRPLNMSSSRDLNFTLVVCVKNVKGQHASLHVVPAAEYHRFARSLNPVALRPGATAIVWSDVPVGTHVAFVELFQVPSPLGEGAEGMQAETRRSRPCIFSRESPAATANELGRGAVLDGHRLRDSDEEDSWPIFQHLRQRNYCGESGWQPVSVHRVIADWLQGEWYKEEHRDWRDVEPMQSVVISPNLDSDNENVMRAMLMATPRKMNMLRSLPLDTRWYLARMRLKSLAGFHIMCEKSWGVEFRAALHLPPQSTALDECAALNVSRMAAILQGCLRDCPHPHARPDSALRGQVDATDLLPGLEGEHVGCGRHCYKMASILRHLRTAPRRWQPSLRSMLVLAEDTNKSPCVLLEGNHRAAPLVLYARECDEEHEVEVLLGVSRHMRNSTYFLGVAAGMDRRAAATGW